MPEGQKVIGMPNDELLCKMFLEASQEGSHDNIKGIVKQLGSFFKKAQGEIKTILTFDPYYGLSLNFTRDSANNLLQGFVNSQNFVVKNTLKILMMSLGASTFDDFLAKMQKDPEDVDITRGTMIRIFEAFFQKLDEKYTVEETTEDIAKKVNAVFGVNDASIPPKYTKITNPQTAGESFKLLKP
ncbi:hypothetical protein AGMMS50249_1140 [candidate division SR1 bacterium]|nr:hypothetical protein AGMMS50249_1140 [candidate division SR1 bacterium]